MSVAGPEIVVVGASAGGVEALTAVLQPLPAEYPLPVMVVLHIPADRDSILPNLFQSKCRLRVKEAEDKEQIEGRTIYFAPPDYHLLIEADRRLSLSSEEPVHYSRPSIDVLFESAAQACGSQVLGVVLTGANSDGAAGLRAICDRGGIALVQDPDTAYASAMPTAARQLCPEASVYRLEEIATCLREVACA